MKHLSAGLVLGLVLAAGAALAADDPVAWSYGNTIVGKNADGTTTKTMVKQDGTYTGIDAEGKPVKGTWVVKDGNYCNTQTDPPLEETCEKLWPAYKVGDKWETKNAETGATISWTLEAGQ
jgi:hypothetical protein